MSPGIRLAVHLCAALWAVCWLGGLPPLRVGSHVIQLGWAGYPVAVLALTWILNLFNFMDGIDGIAGSEAAFVAGAAAFLTLCLGGSAGVAAVALALAGACLGFLLWNWPPAKIFMGDVGSGYLGYVIGVLALAAGREDPTALWVWLILGGVFFVDATVTLIRRVLRGDRVYEAHRSHAYQWLARRWQSHESVTITTTAVNVLWLLPVRMVCRPESDSSRLDGSRRARSYSAPCDLGGCRSARDPLNGANYRGPDCFSDGFDTPASLTSCYLSSTKTTRIT